MTRLPNVFYGWIIVAAVALILAASSGARFSFGVFLKPISEAYGWERAAVSFAITINMILGGLLQPAAGLLVDRVGARVVGTVGTLLIGISFAGMVFATELWQIYLLYGVLGALGTAATSSVLSARLVSAWFRARLSTAMSFSTSGTAIGQILVVPFATWVMLHWGFLTGYQAIAFISVLLVAPFAWMVIRNEPGEKGLAPDGGAAPVAAGEKEAATGVELGVVMRSPVFWQLSFGLIACGVTMSFPSTHLMPYAMDMHMPEMIAGSALGLAGALSMPAAIAVGWLADRFGRARMLAVVYVLRGLTYAFLLVATTESMWFLAAFALGLSWTGTVPLSAAIAADAFGRKHIGVITGTMVMGMWVASGIAAFLAGLIYDHTHSYHLALIGNGLLALAAASVCLGITGERAFPFAAGQRAAVSRA